MRSVAIAAILAVMGTACGGAPWKIVRQAAPDPFVGKGQFKAEALRMDHYAVESSATEEEYLADKPPNERADWESAKKTMAQAFSGALAAEGAGLQFADGAPFIVRPIVTAVDPGRYAVVFARATTLSLTVQLLDAGSQQVLDEINLQTAVGASLYDPAAEHRMGEAAEELGKLTARYVKQRVAANH